MIRIMKLAKANIKIWINEFPQMDKVDIKKYSNSFTSRKESSNLPCKFAIEMQLMKHASSYGLLGMEYSPVKNSNKINIEIDYTKENKVRYMSSLSLHSDYLYIGLEEPYLDFTKNSIENFVQSQNDMPCGTYHFSIAGNCEVGSSPFLFGIISEMLLESYLKLCNSIDVNKIESIIEKAFLNSKLFSK